MGQQEAAEGDSDQQIEIFRIKRLIKTLENARGEGTSMISLIIPPKDQVSIVLVPLSHRTLLFGCFGSADGHGSC